MSSWWTETGATVLRRCVFVLLVLCASAARADEFQAHFDLGLKLYQERSYPAALVEFQAAFKQRQFPRLLYNIARTHHRMGQMKDAVHYYEAFLGADPGMDQATRAEVEKNLAQARALLTLAPSTPAPPEPPPRPPSAAPAPPPPAERPGAATTGATGAPPPPAPPLLTPAPVTPPAAKPPAVAVPAVAVPAAKPPAVALPAVALPAVHPPPVAPPLRVTPRAPLAPLALQPTLPAQRPASRPAGEVTARSAPIYKRWWFWTTIAVVAVGGAATGTAVALSRGSRPPENVDYIYQPNL